MAKLTSKKRKALPARDFALPASRQYPIENKGHAVAAKARATQMANRGVISKATQAKIDAKANRKLGVVDKRARNRKRGV